ncbi:MAG: sigma-54-dependent Fis family transcriptional regulator, partial [Bacteroidaceae bacterium]|nr:sigma-54-dependent Fis family transcriptional regulator [Bacteroidaceae bacterium]
REDLYYRLCTIRVKMPPLRDRGEDMILLFKKFAMDTARLYGIPEPLRLTPEAERVVMSYKWPGNIRQLKNIVEQMSILCQERTVTPDVLADYDIVPTVETTDIALRTPSADVKGAENVEQALKMMQLMIHSLKMDVEMLKQRADGQVAEQPLIHSLPSLQEEPRTEYRTLIPSAPQTAVSGYDEESDFSDYADVDDEEDLNLEKMERRLIEKALRRSRNRRKVAADELGISERTLYRKIKDYGIEE